MIWKQKRTVKQRHQWTALKDETGLLDSGRAYASIIDNVEIDDPDFANGIPTIILFGDGADTVFPELHLCV